jgi:branched-chain amino acid transport system permease protein
MKLFILTMLNGITLAALYFLVAAGFSLIFGLMRNVNLAHGAFYLLGGYLGLEVAQMSGSWLVGVAGGFVSMALIGMILQLTVFRRLAGQDLRQTLVTISISVIAADLMLATWGAQSYQFEMPEVLWGAMKLPVVGLVYPKYRLFVLLVAVAIGVGLWLVLNRTRLGMMIRAGVDNRDMLDATGIDVQRIFMLTFGLGAGLAGLAGVVGGTALSLSPGEDLRYLLASLVVVIVGGLGSVGGAALGALLVGLTDSFGLAYTPTYGIVYTFVLMIAILVWRPQGLMGRV